jgi:hypothetical protein
MPSETWVTRQFRALPVAQRRKFLTAAWTARGYETRVEDAAVFVHDETARVHDDDTRELRVVSRWPWRDRTADVYVGDQRVWIHGNGETSSLHWHIWEDFQRALVWPYHSVLRNTELNVTQVRPFGTQFYRATVGPSPHSDATSAH